MAGKHADRSRRKRVAVAAGVVALSLMGTATVTSEAWFVDEAPTPATFTAGTIDLTTTPTTSALTAANMAHGDVITAPLTVKNTGTLGLRYAMEARVTGALAPALSIHIKTGVTTCTTAGFTATGAGVYGPASALTTDDLISVFGDKAAGPDEGDRVLAAKSNETLCVQVALPLSTNNSYSAKSATATLNFFAEQTANNALQIMSPQYGAGSVSKMTAKVTASMKSVAVNWPASDDRHVKGYILSRTSNNGTTWSTVSTVNDRDITSFTDTGLTEGATYGYTLQAVGFDGTTTPLERTPASNTVVTMPKVTPAAATDVKAVVNDINVALSWTKSSSAWATGYRIQRSANAGSTWTTIASSLAATTTSYLDTAMPLGGTYKYRVIAIGADGTTLAPVGTTDNASIALTTSLPAFVNIINPSGVSRSLDGGLWVTTRLGSLTKIAKSGEITTIVPSGLGTAYGAAEAPDGVVYVATYSNGGGIYKVIPATGALTKLTGNLGDLQGMALGADGNLYAADSSGGRLVKVTPAGVATAFATGLGKPYGVTSSPSGYLYVTDYSGGSLYQFSLTGTKTPITVGTLGSPHGVEVGADGNFYVAVYNSGNGHIAKVNTSGVVSVYAADQGGASDITQGIDGKFYVSDYALGQTTSGVRKVN